MNKELSPLELLEKIKKFENKVVATVKYDDGEEAVYEYNTIEDLFPEYFAVIEKTLKEHVVLKREYEFGVEHYRELLNDYNNDKRIKALEIIKKKKVNVRFLISCKTLKEYNDVISDHLTQEEYDLLMEVLS